MSENHLLAIVGKYKHVEFRESHSLKLKYHCGLTSNSHCEVIELPNRSLIIAEYDRTPYPLTFLSPLNGKSFTEELKDATPRGGTDPSTPLSDHCTELVCEHCATSTVWRMCRIKTYEPGRFMVATASNDKVARIMDVEVLMAKRYSRAPCDDDASRVAEFAHGVSVYSVREIPWKRWLCTAGGGSDYNVKFWDIETSMLVRDFSGDRSKHHNGYINAMDQAPSVGLMFTGGRDNYVFGWDPREGAEAGGLFGLKCEQDVMCVRWVPECCCLLAQASGSRVSQWDLRMLQKPAGPVMSCRPLGLVSGGFCDIQRVGEREFVNVAQDCKPGVARFELNSGKLLQLSKSGSFPSGSSGGRSICVLGLSEEYEPGEAWAVASPLNSSQLREEENERLGFLMEIVENPENPQFMVVIEALDGRWKCGVGLLVLT